MKITKQTEELERGLVFELRRQLGDNYLGLLCCGSRAYGDDLEDSDYDGYCYVKDAKKAEKIFDAAPLEKEYPGVRIGICFYDDSFVRMVKDNYADDQRRFYWASLLGPRARLVDGKDLRAGFPSAAKLRSGNWAAAFLHEYHIVLDPKHPANVLKREPRRHVGYIIATCDQLLLALGVAAKSKRELPALMAKHHPKFKIVTLLRRALWRRENWPRIEGDKRQVAAAKKDVKKFLLLLGRYVGAEKR